MKFTACLAVLGATASLASAFVNPTNPYGETKWVPNSQVNITWDDDSVAPLLTTNPIVDIYLNTGGDQTNIKLATIATGINAGKTSSFLYTVPNVSPPGKIYFLTFVSTGSATPAQAWSTRFTITDASGNPGTLAPSAPVGSNTGAVGSLATASVFLSSPTATNAATTVPAGTATNSGSAATATGTSTTTTKTNGAASFGASALTAAAAVAAGAIALVL